MVLKLLSEFKLNLMIFSYYTKECVIIYSIYKDCISEYKNIDYKIENEVINQNKKRIFVTVDVKLAHQSYLLI
jgi:ABC-type transporter MlaC component